MKINPSAQSNLANENTRDAVPGGANDNSSNAGPVQLPRPVHTPKRRNLSAAIYFRPRDIFELYGIPSSTLSQLCNHPNPERRVPSRKIIGRCGRKGMRLIERKAFDEWLQKWGAAA
jgi:hypothetical protein